MNEITNLPIAIAMFVVAAFYFKIYHSMFRTTYFGNPFAGMLKEFGGCLILAFFTVGLVSVLAGHLFKAVGSIVIFILKVILIIAVLGGIIGGIYLLMKQIKKKQYMKRESSILEETAVTDEKKEENNTSAVVSTKDAVSDSSKNLQKSVGDGSDIHLNNLKENPTYIENTIKVIEKNEKYYLQQFEMINNTGKSRMNWASFFLGLLHATYRNVWKEWIKAVSIPLIVEIAAVLLTWVFLKVFSTLVIVMMIAIAGAGIGFLVAQIMFALHFNVKYKIHVDNKIAQGNLKSDASVGRAIAGTCIFSIVTGIIGAGLIYVLILVFSSVTEGDVINEYVYESHVSIDDFEIKESEANISETEFLNVEAELLNGSYIYDDGEAIYSTAKISKDEIGLRIDIEAMGYGGHQQGFASGYLNAIKENIYSCTDENNLGTFILEVVDHGFSITAHPAVGMEGMFYSIEGDYIFKDLANVGEGNYYKTEQSVNAESINSNEAHYSDVGDTMEEPHIMIPDSSMRELSDSDIYWMTSEQLRIAINEIYARYGRRFKDAELQAWFDAQSWYQGTVEAGDFNDNVLSQLEKNNIDMLQRRRDLNQ